MLCLLDPPLPSLCVHALSGKTVALQSFTCCACTLRHPYPACTNFCQLNLGLAFVPAQSGRCINLWELLQV